MAAERTFVLLKPDAVQRALTGEIVGRFERRGLKVVAMKMLRVTRSLGETYYAEHRGKAFFEPLMSYIAAGPVVAMVHDGDGPVPLEDHRDDWPRGNVRRSEEHTSELQSL